MVVAALASAWASAVAAPREADQAARVVEIRVEGNKQMSANAILIYVRTRPGQVYNEQVVKGDEKRLLETGRFDSVVASRTQTDKGVVVTFAVAERPLVAALVFQGNKAIKDGELAKELSFGAKDPLSAFSVEAGRLALQKKYQDRGYHFANVTTDKTALEQKRQVVYKIVEGPKVRVRKIRFQGNDF
jgi:outer membrane protein insertion porin family